MAQVAEKKEYRLENLSCANCAAKFERNVNELPGVELAQVNFGASKITVIGKVTEDQIDAAGAFDGIKVKRESHGHEASNRPFYKEKENILAAISFVFTLAAIVLEQIDFPTWVPIIAYSLAIIIGGVTIYKVGFANLLKLEFDMKTLMTVAIIGAALIGEWKEAAIVVFLFAVSEALEAYSVNKARRSITSLVEMAPKHAMVIAEHDGMQIDVEMPVDDIAIGSLIRVKPGEKLALDGVVEEGYSYVNEASITGESIAVEKSVGSELFAGTINEQGSLIYRVTKRAEDSTLAHIIHLVEEAQNEKAPAQKFVDKFAKYYTPAIMVLALLISIIPSLVTGDWKHWVYQGLAVLVVGCPCALVISTPVAIVTAIGNAARNGVLIKGGAYLELLGKIKAVAFDKTGTLTVGSPSVKEIFVAQNSKTENELIELVASVEKHSQHPLARAILDEAFNRKITVHAGVEFQSVIGKGAYASYQGHSIYVGSASWIQTMHTLPTDLEQFMKVQAEKGYSIILAATEETLLGAISIADTIRENAKEQLQKLQQVGVEKLVMLTGDNEQTAHAIAQQIGIHEVHSSLMPEQKLQIIEQLKDQNEVAMVGDGVNDAPALAASTVSIAMGASGTDVALETANITLMHDDLSKISETVHLAKRTVRIIKENITFALGLKVLALLLVIPGWLTLWIAIFADIGATLLVIFNSLRLLNNK